MITKEEIAALKHGENIKGFSPTNKKQQVFEILRFYDVLLVAEISLDKTKLEWCHTYTTYGIAEMAAMLRKRYYKDDSPE